MESFEAYERSVAGVVRDRDLLLTSSCERQLPPGPAKRRRRGRRVASYCSIFDLYWRILIKQVLSCIVYWLFGDGFDVGDGEER